MADPRFFENTGPFKLSQIAERTGSVLLDEGQKDQLIEDVETLSHGAKTTIGFFDNRKYFEQFKITKSGACFVRDEHVSAAPEGLACLVTSNPYKSYALAAQMFYPREELDFPAGDGEGFVHETAKLGQGVIIEPGAIISSNVEIGSRTIIRANAVIGAGVKIGEESQVGYNASVTHALIGDRVHIYPGVRIGQRGFGFAMESSGFVSVPQLGRVIIEDDVEIGANTAIDRGSLGDTVIGQGTRIDNQVQIGHGAKIGKQCVLVAQVGISGSTELGDFVMVGGQVGIAGHLKIGSGARIGAQAGIMRDIPGGAEVMGSPSVPIKQFMRQVATLDKLSKQRKGNTSE